MEGGYPGEPSDSDTHTKLCFVDNRNKIEKYTSNSVHDCSYGHSATEYPSSPSGAAGSLFAELANNHRGPVGPKHSEMLQNSLHVSATSGQKATPSPAQPITKTAGLTRDLGINLQGGGTGVDNHAGGGICLHPVPGTKERWRPEASHKPEKSKLLCRSPTLQNGGYKYPEKPVTERRLTS